MDRLDVSCIIVLLLLSSLLCFSKAAVCNTVHMFLAYGNCKVIQFSLDCSESTITQVILLCIYLSLKICTKRLPQLAHSGLLTLVINHAPEPLILPGKGIPKKLSKTLNILKSLVVLFHLSRE